MRTLVLRGLTEDAGTDSETGAILYRTTGYFLERLGMAAWTTCPTWRRSFRRTSRTSRK